jgi:CMP-N-acetylneuraminic acid synthetase
MRVLGIVPARGGSKGIPRKNVAILAGKPLLQYTAEVALAAKTLSRTILSTDDPEIAEIGAKCGLDVPFLRPKELSDDHAASLSVVQHAVRFLEGLGESYDAICLLQPTSPLRKTRYIDECVQLMIETSADSVISVLPVPHTYNPHWVFIQRPDGYLKLCTGEESPITRRQDLPPAFHREGSVYLTMRDVVMIHNSLYGNRIVGYVVPSGETVNLDSLADWHKAEIILKGRDND